MTQACEAHAVVAPIASQSKASAEYDLVIVLVHVSSLPQSSTDEDSCPSAIVGPCRARWLHVHLELGSANCFARNFHSVPILTKASAWAIDRFREMQVLQNSCNVLRLSDNVCRVHHTRHKAYLRLTGAIITTKGSACCVEAM
jgi:hypothetical protein